MLRFLTAGESHGPSLTAILDGMPAGLSIASEMIDKELARRQKGYGSGGRMKIEKDTVQILGGMMAGETTGAPIAMLVQNDDHIKWKGKAIEPMTAPRPGHADLTGAVKYGYKDLRPALERASARETSAKSGQTLPICLTKSVLFLQRNRMSAVPLNHLRVKCVLKSKKQFTAKIHWVVCWRLSR